MGRAGQGRAGQGCCKNGSLRLQGRAGQEKNAILGERRHQDYVQGWAGTLEHKNYARELKKQGKQPIDRGPNTYIAG